MSGPVKHCPCCNRDLPVSSFWADRGRPDGRYRICKQCAAADEARRYRSAPSCAGRTGSVSQEQVQALIAEYQAGGVTVPQLAARVGITHSALAKRFRRLGVAMGGGQPERYPCPFSTERLNELYWKLDHTLNEIADMAAGITGDRPANARTAVRRWLHAADIPIRTPHEVMQRRAFEGKMPHKPPSYETRQCAWCGSAVVRRKGTFQRPPNRTFCGSRCIGAWWSQERRNRRSDSR